jgi:excisionase family DNA binding protein
MADDIARLSLQQVAEWLHVSESTVHRSLDRGELVGQKLGRRWWFDEATWSNTGSHRSRPAGTSTIAWSTSTRTRLCCSRREPSRSSVARTSDS